MLPRIGSGLERPVLAFALVLLLAGVGVLCWCMFTPGHPTPAADTRANPPEILARLGSLTERAYQLQRNRDWCEAEKAWLSVLEAIAAAPAPEELAQEQLTAKGNRELVAELCKPTREPVDALQDLTPRDPPGRIPPGDLLRHYPAGRTTRGVACTYIKGRGTDRNWGLKSTSHFICCHTVAGEVKVEVNDGHDVRFQLHLPEVSQTLFHSTEELELDPPKLRLVELVWKNAEDLMLDRIPEYQIVKKLWGLANTADPNLKKSLTWLAPLVRKAGVNADAGAEIEMTRKVEKLSGLKVALNYTNGVGVTSIQVLEGKKFDPDALQALAESSSLLLDYFIFPGADKAVGEAWTVRSQDVAGLMPLGFDPELGGSMKLQREENASSGDAVLGIKRGQLNVNGRKQNAEESATFFVESGKVFYALTDLMVRHADMRLRANTIYRSRDHLLFQTEHLSDLEIRATYGAERVK